MEQDKKQPEPQQPELTPDNGQEPQQLPPEIPPELLEQVEPAPQLQQGQAESLTGSDSDIYTREEFILGFREAFGFASDLSGIKSLAIDMADSKQAIGSERAASRLYDASLKYKWLSFLTDKKTSWLADAVIIGGFVAGKAQAVAVEVGQPSIKDLILGKFKWLKRKKTISPAVLPPDEGKPSGLDSSAQVEPVRPTEQTN